MKFDQHIPSANLKPYIKHYIISESDQAQTYKVFPTTGLVIGFQYSGRLSTLEGHAETPLSTAGITGITDTYRVFKNSGSIGTVLVYFTEVGFTHFAAHPAHDLFNLSMSLDDIFDKHRIAEVEDKLALAGTDQARIRIVEHFLQSQLKDIQTDRLIVEAVRLIYQSRGTIRIRELIDQLCISQSPFEKRFRKVVGTSPKKFASIVRFNAVLDDLGQMKSLIDICHEHHFFDQAHFSKDFKRHTGDSPETFQRQP